MALPLTSEQLAIVSLFLMIICLALIVRSVVKRVDLIARNALNAHGVYMAHIERLDDRIRALEGKGKRLGPPPKRLW